jgi:[protein-PII] uridylyltransferase
MAKPQFVAHTLLIENPDFVARLADLVKESGKPVLAVRNGVTALVKEALAQARLEAERRLRHDGKGTRCAELLSHVQDQIIGLIFDFACTEVFPGEKTGAATESLSVIAVGGYGRGTLAPGSDIDLLFLVPAKPSPRSLNIIEFILYTLWDARQKVGHATRSIDECLKLAKTDNTILTSILEARYICGDRLQCDQLLVQFRKTIVQTGARKFVADKLAERDTRLTKTGESRYAVEPDLKDGKGGLRDLHTLFWIAKFLFATNSPDELAEKGAFSRDELARFKKCEDYLWAVRCHLHFIAKRGEDKLSFDRQAEMAERLGYQAHGGLKNVERFMKHYFLIAKEVGDLTRIFCASLEARQMKDVPTLQRVIGRFMPSSTGRISGTKDFHFERGRIDIVDGAVFARDPVNLIRLFRIAGQREAEIHPDALKQVRKSLKLIDRELCDNPEANRLFLEILTESAAPDTVLRMMNEAGVLGRFIPEFGKIVAMMQFNMYHHYTVDEHLIRSVGVLQAIARGTERADHPLADGLFPGLTNRRALYVATLLHDVAKGRPEDHSIAGERIARTLAPRLGLSASETELVAWLIRHHLLMSETAQMRDLNDFKTILDFTGLVQSPERLKLLLILTVCDIRAVGPGVWNGWKGQLLRTLYNEAEPLLSGGHTAVSRKDRVQEAQQKFLSHFPDWDEATTKRAAQKHYDAYWLNVATPTQLRHQALISRSINGDVVTDIRTDAFTAITEVTIFAADHPRLLARITGACAAAGANIMGAQIFTTTDGLALDTILVSREFTDEKDEMRRATRIADTIVKVLHGEIRLRDELAKPTSAPSRLKAFSVEPRVMIDNESSNRQTVIEINGLDRVGLLHGLTDALFHLNLNIASAHVTTFGEKAIDVFYVTDLTGAKIINPNRQTQIEQALMAVLTTQARAFKETA